jgi:tRNA (guanosine-2'-O-)-methyltransferase
MILNGKNKMAEISDKVAYLSQFITADRFNKMLDIIENRTYKLSIVLEDIYQTHNASAVVRSCECFGVQDLHIIENRNRYQLNPEIVLGSNQWVTMKRYSDSNKKNTKTCLDNLKAEGYRIIATTPHKNGVNLENLPIHGKMAIVFGSEKEGLSEEAMNLANEFMFVPMYGFTESLNISVTVAIVMHYLSLKIRKESEDWKLTEEEMNKILLSWFEKTIKNYHSLEKSYNKTLE